MIYVTYQCFNGDKVEGKVITKNFKSIEEQKEWEEKQLTHPFLQYKSINVLDPNSMPNSI